MVRDRLGNACSRPRSAKDSERVRRLRCLFRAHLSSWRRSGIREDSENGEDYSEEREEGRVKCRIVSIF